VIRSISQLKNASAASATTPATVIFLLFDPMISLL
jgi:hypothetical protein